jgi:hypothetical protein
MRYEQIDNPATCHHCFVELSKEIDRFIGLAQRDAIDRPNLFFNFGAMLACVLYVRANEDYTWLAPFIEGVNHFMDDASRHHTPKDPVIIAFQHPDVPQA